MSFAEVKELLPTLSIEERAELAECLQAIEEGVSVEELRAINAALDEEINDPSPTLSSEQVRTNLRNFVRKNAPPA
jgi:hypothetical protein